MIPIHHDTLVQIRVARQKQTGMLTVDGRFSKQTKSPKKADILDVVGVLYIGGLPVNYTTKRIGPVRSLALSLSHTHTHTHTH